MCGIVGYIGNKRLTSVLMDGLRRLEYRGYDSAGLAVVNDKGLEVVRCAGKLRDLEEALRLTPLDGAFGVGHTRWATHGRPTEENAHPHRDCTGNLVVVHNGIIENYVELKHELQQRGHAFKTETDTEVMAHLFEEKLKDHPLEEAVRLCLPRLRGVYAICVIAANQPKKIIAARNGPPLVVGLGKNEYFVASDIPAILHHTRDVFFLDDREVAMVTDAGAQVKDLEGRPVTKKVQRITWDPIMAEKSGFKHFMLKEIYEQPRAVRDTLRGRVSSETGKIFLEEMDISPEEFRKVRRISLVACGTSWHAALVGKFLLERLVRVPVEVDIGSEFRYRDPILFPEDLVVVISQSGETADTLAAQREAKAKGLKTVAICNVVGSMITREADGVIFTHAGPEIGVASTKAFTCQLAALQLLALHLAEVRGTLEPESAKEHIAQLLHLPVLIEKILQTDPAIEEVAKEYYRASDFLFLGRGVNYPIALEGALKLKEISYIHAEGYPAGEMKHGPIALIDRNLPVVALAFGDKVFEKMMGNIEEVKAREGRIIAVTQEGNGTLAKMASHTISIPKTADLLTPILAVIPLQLLAYHIALRRGCDVDQPRNLAKSVTVE
ncbi:MAG: glutamine--fructose-6-phosphate transaminase (isomerizing) [Acidobacteria bacterium]|uniref:Glutamine--fructose-6-phosphate aminotransferase [isomerizing] n=1 Tax=Eiseniibacteriota bacterium TaxID=2212470 RepID=A0A538SLG0_UNCEI|nr:MAG: glutamine--fructose-6-phosphate transaminase (isomerizing) [Acidobacteriota bacterium]TMQ52209.1 MAG: glutamine--fructose-6-phosphate transaminase (isomerizing) [Candidatus Eisenbacteria bacterium]